MSEDPFRVNKNDRALRRDVHKTLISFYKKLQKIEKRAPFIIDKGDLETLLDIAAESRLLTDKRYGYRGDWDRILRKYGFEEYGILGEEKEDRERLKKEYEEEKEK